MKGQYASAIEKTSEVLIEWLMKDTDALIGEGRGLDRGVCNVLREVGRRVMAGVYEQLGNTLVGRLREPGYNELGQMPNGFSSSGMMKRLLVLTSSRDENMRRSRYWSSWTAVKSAPAST